MLFNVPSIEVPVELFFLFVFLVVCELFPMPVPKGLSSLTFPVLYILYILYGIELTLLLHFVAVLSNGIIRTRPLRTIFFNPAQLVVSFYLAHVVYINWQNHHSFFTENPVLEAVIGFTILISVFYLVNNLLVDLVLLIRPEKYTFSLWAQKGQGELFSFFISFIYGYLIHFLGSQNRGEIDIFSYFFFFSPLVALSLLSSIILRLKSEKNRLKALFQFSSELNKTIPSKDWEGALESLIKNVMVYEDCLLFRKKENGQWEAVFIDGKLKSCKFSDEVFDHLEAIKAIKVFDQKSLKKGPLAEHFCDRIQAAVYAPLLIDEEVNGCLVLTKTRTKSFIVEDIRSIATVANQLAIFLKTKMLFSEKEQRILLEERNRIAHDIHDGIAQTLAGAVMKLDISVKKITGGSAAEAKNLILDSNEQLRAGLKAVRDSIYALKPYPTEQLGLHSAIEKKVRELNEDHSLQIKVTFVSRGKKEALSPMTEKVIFDVLKESLQNCVKHAEAAEIQILLSYQTDHILLKIADGGKGFSLLQAMKKAMKEPHYGIFQMNEAAEKIGAALQIESKEGRGTIIELKVPKMGLEGEF
ncbi:histidine kinase [Jeotgalibacillus soli]|uniref:histidine kinase n=2 Tax=Jeotgalibacillus soli TaxID=889306 RepID=A0A0C2W7G7_9BACL|nr:histidine kinase [Jeotgalibacillus soli]